VEQRALDRQVRSGSFRDRRIPWVVVGVTCVPLLVLHFDAVAACPEQALSREQAVDGGVRLASQQMRLKESPAARRGVYIRFSLGTGLVARTTFERNDWSLSPLIRTTWEVGRPSLAFLLELETAPVPHFFRGSTGQPFGLQFFGGGIGVVGGNQNIRGGLSAAVGAIYARVQGRLTITPWITARGHRHGLEFAAGWAGPTVGEFVAGYRFVPGLRRLRARNDERRRSRGKPPRARWRDEPVLQTNSPGQHRPGNTLRGSTHCARRCADAEASTAAVE
jgi:hypothetical protein